MYLRLRSKKLPWRSEVTPSPPSSSSLSKTLSKKIRSMTHLSLKSSSRHDIRSPRLPSRRHSSILRSSETSSSSSSAHTRIWTNTLSSMKSPPPQPSFSLLGSPPSPLLPSPASDLVIPWVFVTSDNHSVASFRAVRRQSRVTPMRGLELPSGHWTPTVSTPRSPSPASFKFDRPCAVAGAADRLRDFGLLVAGMRASFSSGLSDAGLDLEDGSESESEEVVEDLTKLLEEVAQEARGLGRFAPLEAFPTTISSHDFNACAASRGLSFQVDMDVGS
ncbi:hypothetical protein BV25DRAFT_1917973 [Artomyces pyxidatus]|uniref:Uncharacterized protein n=1 Tax=Artomyces pyxidatus TaxID=48021 RepID=A0ACB8SW13_9AGAM|nr:hypothetical protein BV25DRAFT_1917973 [Artomyces pyxidatus]